MKSILLLSVSMFMTFTASAQCIITDLIATIGSCESPTDTYSIDGIVEFNNAPTTGTLLVSVVDGITVYDTIINPPFVSPAVYSISGMAANGNSTTISAVFSDDLTCTISINSNSPASCACTAEAGTFTYTSNLFNGTTHYVAYGSNFTITSNLDHTFANEVNTGFGPSYDTSMAYLAFSCVPSTPATPYSDPCMSGIIGYGTSLSVACNSSSLLSNPYYVQPITMYSAASNVYSHTTDPNFPCFDLGLVQEVYCLGPIVPIVTSNPGTGEITVTVSGGMPAVDGSNFTISNVWPPAANGGVTSVAQNGSVVLSGLLNGDQYTMAVTDDAGGYAWVSNMYVSVDESKNLPLSFYPNPVKDHLVINGVTESTDVIITTMDGVVILATKLTQNEVIATAHWSKGVYLISGNSANGSIAKKVVKL